MAMAPVPKRLGEGPSPVTIGRLDPLLHDAKLVGSGRLRRRHAYGSAMQSVSGD